MKRIHYVLASAAIVATAGIGIAAQQHKPVPLTPVSSRVAPAAAYPNPTLTTGKADTLSVADLTRTWTENCPPGKSSCTYSQDHRNVPAAEHTQVYVEYNVPASGRNIQSGEVDHYYPLCAGGSNDISNLWYQPVSVPWNGEDVGFHTKDKLESWVCVQIKAGKLDPKEAFKQITTDWVAYYEANKAAIGSTPAF